MNYEELSDLVNQINENRRKTFYMDDSVDLENEKENEKEKNRFNNIECPVCKSKNKTKVEKQNNNGIIGSGYSSWVTESYLVYNDCGVMYKDLKK